MKVNTKVELKLEGFEKCSLSADSDTPIGQLYDYACALKAFIYTKIKDSESEQAQAPCTSESPADELPKAS